MLKIHINKHLFRQIDYRLCLLIYTLSIIGIVVIYGSTASIPHLRGLYLKQFIWLGISTLAFALILCIDYTDLRKIIVFLYVANILVLVFLLVRGRSIHGSASWLAIWRFSIQPSEFMKFITVIFLAMIMSEEREKGYDRIEHFGKPLLVALIPMLLILKQPDLGTAAVFLPVLLVMLYAAKAKTRPLIIFIMVIVVGAIVVFPFLKSYQKERIFIFLNPGSDSLGKGYNIIQSQIALGSGRLFGKGWCQGTQTALQFLPEHHTDFIFSSLVEQFGFIGSAIVIFLYYGVVQRSVAIAKASKDFFGSYMVVGLITIVGVHTIMNVGMASGMLPVTGIPLPFISYGGSSLLSTFIIFALIVNVRIRQYMF